MDKGKKKQERSNQESGQRAVLKLMDRDRKREARTSGSKEEAEYNRIINRQNKIKNKNKKVEILRL